MTPTRRLAAFCAGATESRSALPQHLLDWLAVTVGGANHADSTPSLLAGVRELAGDPAGDGRATVLPTGERLAPADAALANGALAHSLDFDDTHLSSSLHPGAPVIAAALASAEAIDAPTARLLAGIAAGYDVACTVGEAVNPDAHYGQGFHITATCGTFGATAAAGVVRDLDADAFEDAFGLNGSQVAGSLQFLENGAWNKRLHPGLAARRGVEAVALADAGFVGAEDPIEGEFGFFESYTDEPDYAAFDRLESRDAIEETGLKPYPCCRYLHPAVDGLLAVSEDVDPASVERVRIALPKAGIRLTGDPIEAKRRPENFVDCQFSAPFAAALALAEGAAGGDAFLHAVGRLDDPPRFGDDDLRRLMDATEVGTDDEVQRRFPAEWTARVRVETETETRERFVEEPLGEPAKPMTWGDTVAKTRGLVETGDEPIDADRLTDVVRDVETHSVADVVDAATR